MVNVTHSVKFENTLWFCRLVWGWSGGGGVGKFYGMVLILGKGASQYRSLRDTLQFVMHLQTWTDPM